MLYQRRCFQMSLPTGDTVRATQALQVTRTLVATANPRLVCELEKGPLDTLQVYAAVSGETVTGPDLI